MDHPASRRLVWRSVSDSEHARKRADRLTALLAVALERRLTSGPSVDFNADVSVHPDMTADGSPW
jgi:hypothetical protein